LKINPRNHDKTLPLAINFENQPSAHPSPVGGKSVLIGAD